MTGYDRADDHEGGRACPTCGETIAAIVTVGPGVHRLSPCGHRAGAMRTADIARAER